GPSRTGTTARSTWPLLNGHDSADWNFSKELSCSFAGQSNAAVGRGIIRHHAFVHSEIETTQAHEIGHVDVINGRTMIAFLVSDDEIAALGGITVPTGRTG